ncbi:MAG: tetratricopeptide repeat protein [Candidatus Aminicenantes bacterium]|nr:tetratricopeptide repeat protein [Candidatus Aminicenantes bacterium]
MPGVGEAGPRKTFQASTAKDVLSLISRELGPDAVILAHRKIRDSDGRIRFEVTAAPGSHQASAPIIPPSLEGTSRKDGKRKALRPALAVVLLAVAAGAVWRLGFKRKAAESPPPKTSIAVIGFENQTGDASYDYLSKVIPNLLITSLEQTSLFDVVSWERLHDLLEQAGVKNSDLIEKDEGFALGRKDDIDVIVVGSFARTGEMFVTDAKVLDAKTKKIRSSASSKGAREESIIQTQIDELGREISQGLGFLKPAAEETTARIADITTGSLDAYDHYLRGRDAYSNENLKEARIFLEKAVELDSQFAMAHFFLASSLSISGERKAAMEVCEKARRLSARATQKERLFIQGMSVLLMGENPDEGLRIFNEMASLYPKEKNAHYGLGLVYSTKGLPNQAIEEYRKALELDPYDGKILGLTARVYWGQRAYEKAVEYFRRQIADAPGNGLAKTHLAMVYLEMGKIDEAMAACREAFEADPDLRINASVPYIYALRENYDEAIRLMGRLVQVEKFSYFEKSIYHYWTGSLRHAEDDLRRYAEYAAATKSRQSEANVRWVTGWIAYERNELDLCRKSFDGWFEIYRRDILPKRENAAAVEKHWTAWHSFYVGLVDIKEGDLGAAKSRLAEMKSLLPAVLPEYQNWIAYLRDFLEAEISLAEGDVPKAIRVAKQSPPQGGWINQNNRWLYNVPFLRDVLARAYLRIGKIDEAITEYEKLIRLQPGSKEQNWIHPRYYFRLAELYERTGEKTKAGRSFERFLDLWKEADPDIPEVLEAKTRLARLKNDHRS